METRIAGTRIMEEKALLPFSKGANQGDRGGKGRYCIRCAVSRPDFKERAPLGHPMPLEEEEQARAWIDGRGYSLVRQPRSTVCCTDCGEVIRIAYCPEESTSS